MNSLQLQGKLNIAKGNAQIFYGNSTNDVFAQLNGYNNKIIGLCQFQQGLNKDKRKDKIEAIDDALMDYYGRIESLNNNVRDNFGRAFSL
ncbi:MAG: hypothetical protein BM564_01070 [Bacteroidetes bacterium MedPE-SWsnd-G2]|nr:MAG: hypothetical protein BM564_01070 [Bacteroidetes bacterium MedPE-SWsnd-G2]